jgi:hypothetical protein
MRIGKGTQVIGDNLSSDISTANPIRFVVRPKSRCWKMVTNCLSYGTASIYHDKYIKQYKEETRKQKELGK